MVIYKREMFLNKNPLIIYSTIVFLLTFWLISMYPSFAENQTFTEMIGGLPESMIKAFNLNKLNLTTVEGFYATEVYTILILVGGIFSGTISGTIISKEEDKRTADFLLSKPVTRFEIYLQKLFAYLTNVLIFSITSYIAALIALTIFVNEYNLKIFIHLNLAAFLFMLSIGGVGFLLSAVLTSERTAMSIAIAFVLVAYFLDIFSKLIEKLEPIGYISPAKYADAVYIVDNGTMSASSILVLLAITAVGTITGYLFYSSKDIAA